MTATKKSGRGVHSPAATHHSTLISERQAEGVSTADKLSLPVRMQIVADHIPHALRDLRGWLVWKYEWNRKTQRWDKVPRWVGGARRRGLQGGPGDLARLATFAEALARFEAGECDGVGLAMLPQWGLVGLDLDRKAGKEAEHLSDAELAELHPGTYCERSPSGKGVRAFYLGQMHNIKGGKRGVEVFSQSQFLTVTGDMLPGSPVVIAPLPDALRAKLDTFRKDETKPPDRDDVPFGPKARMGLTVEQVRDLLAHLPADYREEYAERWLHVCMAVHHEGQGSEPFRVLLHEYSRPSPKYDAAEVDKKYDSFHREAGAVTMWSLAKVAREHDWAQPPLHAAAAVEFGPVESDVSDDDLDSYKLPTMPPEALYGVLKAIVDAATANSEATVPGVAAAALTHFAARFGKALGIDVADERRTLPLYVLLVGPTGRGRKGTSSHFASQLFDDVDKLLANGWGDLTLSPHMAVPSLHVVSGVSSGQGLIELVRDDNVPLTRSGIERMVDGVEDKRLLLDLSEFGLVFSVSAQESNTLSMVLRDAFDGRTLDNPTRTNPLRSTGAHVSVLGHITMSEFRRRTVDNKRSTDTHNGLLNRFLVMYSVRDRIVTRPEPVPEAIRRELAGILANNVHAVFDQHCSDHRGHRRVVLRMTHAAWRLWEDEYPRITSATYDSEYVYAMMARRELHTLVIAALLAAMNGESAVDVPALRAGLAWGAYVADTNTRVFATIAQRQQAQRLRAWVAKLRGKLREHGVMDLRQIQQRFHNSAFTPEQQKLAIRHMAEASPPLIEFLDGKAIRLTEAGKAV